MWGKYNQSTLATRMKLSKMRMNIKFRTVTYVTQNKNISVITVLKENGFFFKRFY